jgi:hypothetical protein
MSGQVGDANLKFKASMFLMMSAVPGVGLSVAMVGMWEKAFGIKPLSIGNLFGELVVSFTTEGMPYIISFDLGGQAQLGEAKLAIGISSLEFPVVFLIHCFTRPQFSISLPQVFVLIFIRPPIRGSSLTLIS